MPRFLILIDDGELVASDAGTVYRDMDAAADATLRAAVLIAGERAAWTHVDQRLACEIKQHGTNPHREFDVLLRVNSHVAGSGAAKRGTGCPLPRE